MKKFLFTLIGGTNHLEKVKYSGHEITMPEKIKMPKYAMAVCRDTSTTAHVRNEVYQYRQFGIDAETNYGFYCLKGLSNGKAMELAGIVRIK